MSVEELERRFYELKGRLDVGAIGQDEFKREIEKLRFQDSQERWWMIGAQSGKWYYFDGARWIPGQPPAEVPVPLSPAAPAETLAESPRAATTPASVPREPAPPVEPTPPVPLPVTTAAETPRAAAVTPPPQPEHLPRAAKERPRAPARVLAPPKLPVSGILLVIGAAVLALIGVLVFWILVENFVPGKPISTFLGNLTGSKPIVATPTSPASLVPKELPALVNMGDQLLLQSHIDAAITQYQSAAQLAPNHATPLVRLARAYAFKGQLEEARARAQQAVQHAPTDAEAHAQFCRALAWLGQVNEAVVVCEKATQLDGRNVHARAFLAEAYLLARRVPDAQSQAQLALQVAPQNAEAHRAQAWVLTLQGQKDAALAEWKQTIALEPNFYFRHFEYGEALRLYLGNPAEAAAEHQKAVDLYGAYIPAINRLGLALLAANKPQEAMAPLQRVLTLDPNRADNYAYLGIAYGQAHQCTQAIPYFEQALNLDVGNVLAQRGLVDCKSGRLPTLPPAPPPSAPPAAPTLVPKP